MESSSSASETEHSSAATADQADALPTTGPSPPGTSPSGKSPAVEAGSTPSRAVQFVGYVYTSLLQLGFVFAAYVFSTGPAYWAIYEAYTFGDNPLLQKFYRPLVWLAERSETFSNFLDWWIGLWIL